MTGKTHATTGALAGIICAKYLGTDLSLALITVVGAYGPDIDIPTSYLGRKTKPFSTAIHKTFGHRTITHSFLGMFLSNILLSFILYFIANLNNNIAYSSLFHTYFYLFVHFNIGYITHIIGDLFTKHKIPLFYPFKKRYGFSLFTSGGTWEYLILLGSVSLIVLQVWNYWTYGL